jgi:hypothetical protein
MMPGVDGMALLRYVRSTAALAGVPVISAFAPLPFFHPSLFVSGCWGCLPAAMGMPAAALSLCCLLALGPLTARQPHPHNHHRLSKN